MHFRIYHTFITQLFVIVKTDSELSSRPRSRARHPRRATQPGAGARRRHGRRLRRLSPRSTPSRWSRAGRSRPPHLQQDLPWLAISVPARAQHERAIFLSIRAATDGPVLNMCALQCITNPLPQPIPALATGDSG